MAMERPDWVLSLPPGSECSIGSADNETVKQDGSTSRGRANEDRYYTCYFQDRLQLYMVLDGHDGTKAVEFARRYIPHTLLQRSFSREEKEVKEALRTAFLHTEQAFFSRIDGHITRMISLQNEIDNIDSATAYRLFRPQVDEISQLSGMIQGGTTVVAALIHENKLYVANIGDSRALLCSQNYNGVVVKVEQISVDHDTRNKEELQRLAGCGLDPNKLQLSGRLGMQQNTRSIGDYSIKGGYKNVDVLRLATSQPGTAEPYLHVPVDLSAFHGFLVLMSDGLYEAYEAWTGRPDQVNEDIAHLVASELSSNPDLNAVAQRVVDRVMGMHREVCQRAQRFGRLDDATLVIKSLITQHMPRRHPVITPSLSSLVFPVDREFDQRVLNRHRPSLPVKVSEYSQSSQPLSMATPQAGGDYPAGSHYTQQHQQQQQQQQHYRNNSGPQSHVVATPPTGHGQYGGRYYDNDTPTRQVPVTSSVGNYSARKPGQRYSSCEFNETLISDTANMSVRDHRSFSQQFSPEYRGPPYRNNPAAGYQSAAHPISQLHGPPGTSFVDGRPRDISHPPLNPDPAGHYVSHHQQQQQWQFPPSSSSSSSSAYNAPDGDQRPRLGSGRSHEDLAARSRMVVAPNRRGARTPDPLPAVAPRGRSPSPPPVPPRPTRQQVATPPHSPPPAAAPEGKPTGKPASSPPHDSVVVTPSVTPSQDPVPKPLAKLLKLDPIEPYVKFPSHFPTHLCWNEI